MNPLFMVIGLATGLIQPGDDITERFISALEKAGSDPFRDGDILVLAESMIATAEGRIISLDTITPSSWRVNWPPSTAWIRVRSRSCCGRAMRLSEEYTVFSSA
jgi:F420-0:gamma-glutamyl ligase-like protein